MTYCLFWGLPEDALVAPASALCGWNGVILALILSLSPSLQHPHQPCVARTVLYTLSPSLSVATSIRK